MKESPSRNEKKPFFTPHLWLIVLLYLLITVSHYSLPPFFSGLPTSFLGLARHSIERVLLLVPISYAGVACPPYKTLAGGAFGIVGGIVSLAISLVIMLPQAFLLSQGAGVFLEIAGVLLIGTVINLWLFTHRREVAERKRVEGMLTKIIDASSIPAFVIDREHKVTHWNTAL